MIKNMTQGKPGLVLLKFALPLMGSMIFQQMYNLADSVIAGKYINDNALAAVGASYPVTAIFTAVAVGLNIGSSVIISQLFGAGNKRETKTAVFTSLITALITAVLLTGLGFAFCKPLLSVLNTPPDFFSWSADYLYIYTAGLLFVFLYNACTGAFTALGDSVTPFCFLVFSSVGNIVLDIVFTVSFKLGVPGIAWATFICQGIAGTAAFAVLAVRLKRMKTDKFPVFSFTILKRISRIAIPSILQQSFISVGNLLIQSVVNGYSNAVIAGYSAAVKLNTFAITMFTAVSNAISSFSAQNIGAGRLDRVRSGYRAGIFIAVFTVLPFTVFYVFAGKIAMLLFVSSESVQTIAEGAKFLQYVAPFYIVAAYKLVCDGILHGSAAVKCFTSATFTDLILRALLAEIFPMIFPSAGASAIWLAWPVGWIISTVMSACFYHTGIWKKALVSKT